MRVAFITTSYPRTATDAHGHFVARIAEGLAARDVQVTAHAPHFAGASETEVRGGVEVRRFRYGSDSFEQVAYGPGVLTNVRTQWRAAVALPAFLMGLRNATRKAARDADILHVHWAQAALVGSAGSRNVPLALTIHGSDLQLAQHPSREWTLRRPLAQAAAVMAVSAELAEQLQPFMPQGRLPHVVHGGVDGSLLGLEHEPVQRTDGTVELLFVGRLVPEKGVFDLVEALKHVRTGFRLTVVGVGSSRAEMERRIRGAGLDHVVEFAGALPHEDVIERMRTADIVIMPSHREGCGLVPIEAAAVGAPVIVTSTGAMPEVAACDEAIVAPGDVDALTAAVTRMIEDPVLRATCSREGRARVREDFIWDRIVEQTLEIYESILKRPAS